MLGYINLLLNLKIDYEKKRKNNFYEKSIKAG
jgi:hypothetical protein